MNIIIVDSNLEDKEKLIGYVEKRYSKSRINFFEDPMMAFKYSFSNSVDIAYIAVEMKRLNGFELGTMLRVKYPKIDLRFLGEKEAYRKNTIDFNATEYLIKSEHLR